MLSPCRSMFVVAACLTSLAACGDDSGGSRDAATNDSGQDGGAGLDVSPNDALDGGDGGGPSCDLATTRSIVHIDRSITAPTVWTHGNTYVIDQSIVISATLTVEPCTIVKFNKGPAFTFSGEGSIVADGGSAATPIVFTSIKDDAHGGDTNADGTATSPAPGDWASIKVSGSGSVFNHCRIMYGGSSKPYSGALSVVNGGTATIANCVFAHNDGGTLADQRAAALHVGGGAATTAVTGNTFYDNGIPLVISATQNLDDSNEFHAVLGGQTIGNRLNGIFVEDAVSTGVTWAATDAPFVLAGVVLSITDTGTLTLGDNVVFKADRGRIDVANLGVINQGTGNVFTSLMDDTVMGDTNGDGSASTPIKGDWSGVNLCKPLCSYANWSNIKYAANP